MDVRWILTPANAAVPSFYKSFEKTARYTLYKAESSGIGEYVGVRARQSAASQQELFRGNADWYISDAISTRQFIRWDYMSQAQNASSPVPRCAGGGQILSERMNAGEVQVEAACATASPFMLKFTYHPNWRITVDGRATLTYMLSPSFVGIDLPAGRHVVLAKYVATPMKLPLFALGMLVLLVSFVLRDRLDLLPSRIIRRAIPQS
jgi:hypothetical protein